ncbi:hypothetical protein JTB14_000807 [Gonioctena quinquepunctata]|nr:hypothetical protein JTB14_000807 [Gonioctena quinquepunctata]
MYHQVRIYMPSQCNQISFQHFRQLTRSLRQLSTIGLVGLFTNKFVEKNQNKYAIIHDLIHHSFKQSNTAEQSQTTAAPSETPAPAMNSATTPSVTNTAAPQPADEAQTEATPIP